MGHTIDLVGAKYGRLLVLSKTNNRDVCGNVLWECLCDCGNIVEVRTSNLKNLHAQSCGCLCKEINGKRVFRDLTGQRFGWLTVIEFAGGNVRNKSTWWCRCDCGAFKIVGGNALTASMTVSCGCYHSMVSSMNCGEKHRNWKGGYSDKDYPKEWNRNLKEFIRNRDERKCQYPDCQYDDTVEKQRLSVHHIDGKKSNCRTKNLISLCNSHHHKVENNSPELWAERFYVYTESFEV